LKMKKSRTLFLTLLAGMLLILAGCQSVGGFDLNKAMMGQLTTESLEGRMEIVLDLEFFETLPEWTDPEAVETARALDGLKIVLDEIKQENPETASFKGSLVIRRGEIPFHAYMDKTRVIVSIEGAGTPLEFSLEDAGLPIGGGIYGGGFGSGLGLERELRDKELIKALASLAFKHLDNPGELSVQRVVEPVNGVSVSMHKLHAEIAGPEMSELFTGFLTALVKDDEGLKKVVALFYDAVLPRLEEAGDFPLGFFLSDLSNNRELAIEYLHVFAKQSLLFVLYSLQSENGFATSGLSDLFTEETGVVADLYFDGSLNLRKNKIELTLAPDLSEWEDDSGVRSVKLTVSGEYWNHGGAVKAELPEGAEEANTLYDLEAQDEWLKQLDKQSVLYKWLKEDLHATRKTVSFFLIPDAEADETTDPTDEAAEPSDETSEAEEDWASEDWEYEDWEYEDWEYEDWEYEDWEYEDWEWEDEWWWYPVEERPLLLDGKMVVPARYFADSLGLDLEWNGETRSIIISGGDPETVIVLVVDSSIATVNGIEQDMGVPVILRDGRAYIPLRFVSEALGAKVEWIAEENTAVVTLD